jgi:hypothetical protein
VHRGQTDERLRIVTVSNKRRHLRVTVALAVVGLTFVACGAGSTAGDGTTTATEATPVVDPGDGGNYAPTVDPTDFVDGIDNAYLPFTPGSRWVYEGTSDGESETVEVTVTPERREVMGVSTVVVRDTVTVGGALVEDTFDWFAQDKEGNVWYFGEEVEDYENGKVASTAGSWEAGVDGALPGIVMPATPAVGDAFRQEYFAGEAEDMFEILGLDESVQVPFGTFEGVLVTEDWSPLEPDVVESKYYARGVGKIKEEKVAGGEGVAELVTFETGP